MTKKYLALTLLFGLSFGACNNSYLYGVPPAPPFQKIELTICDNLDDGCNEAPNELIGYIIEVKENERLDYDFVVQDEQGVREKCSLNTGIMGNAQASWLSHILIPGNKVKMKVQYCGSGGFIYVMNIKSLRRHLFQ